MKENHDFSAMWVWLYIQVQDQIILHYIAIVKSNLGTFSFNITISKWIYGGFNFCNDFSTLILNLGFYQSQKNEISHKTWLLYSG